MDRPAVAAEVLPLGVELPAAAATQEKLAPAIVVSDTAVAQELTEMLHLESEAPTTVWIPPDALPPDLRPREGHTALPISPTIGPISAANAGYPVPHLAGALPASFETHVQIKRWGLKIRFQKA
jgi:hypothetical protein